MAPAKHHHAHHRHDHGVHKNDRKYHEEKHKRAAEAQQAALLAAAAKGDVEGVMQFGLDRATRRAAETANEQGWFRSTSSRTTARPTTTMLLCQHARNKGDNSHHGVRATPALLSALRAAYPGAATECLPQARKNGLGEKTAESLLPFDLPHREACVAALRENALDMVKRDDHDRFEAERLKGQLKFEARRAADAGDAPGVVELLKHAHGHYSGITDVLDDRATLFALPRPLRRDLDDASFDYLFRASPGAPFREDFQRMLPIHTLMNGCEAATPHMVRRLNAAHPKGGAHRGLRGWTPLHFFCMRNPTWPRAAAILALLLDTKSGAKACRLRDQRGDLPIHLFCQTCADLKDVVEQEIASGNYGRARRRPPPKKKTKVENVRAAFRRTSVAVGLAGGGDDDDEPEAPEEEAYAWNADQAVACVKLLVKAYPESWRLAGKGKVTSLDLAPPELHEAMLKAADGRAGDGSESSDDDLDNKFNLAKFEDGLHDVKTHKHQRHKVDLETADLGDVVDDGKTDEGLCSRLLRRYDGANARDAGEHGGFLLHRLLRRKPDVGADVLRAVLTWSSKAARTADGEGWHPLHLLARRATTDRLVTGASARRVLNTFRECAVLRGGGDGRLQNPLAALCAHLTHKSAHVKTPLSYENHWTKETYDEWEQRMVAVARALADGHPDARTQKTAHGHVAVDLLPAHADYDGLRAVARPPPRRARGQARPGPHGAAARGFASAPSPRRRPATPRTRRGRRRAADQVHPAGPARRGRRHHGHLAAADGGVGLRRPAVDARRRRGGATPGGTVARPTTSGGTLRPTTPGGTLLVRLRVDVANAQSGRPATPLSPGGTRLATTPRETRTLRPLTPGGSLRPLTPGGGIQHKPLADHGLRRPKTPDGSHLVPPLTPGGTFRPTTRGGTLLRDSNLHEHTHDFNGNPIGDHGECVFGADGVPRPKSKHAERKTYGHTGLRIVTRSVEEAAAAFERHRDRGSTPTTPRRASTPGARRRPRTPGAVVSFSDAPTPLRSSSRGGSRGGQRPDTAARKAERAARRRDRAAAADAHVRDVQRAEELAAAGSRPRTRSSRSSARSGSGRRASRSRPGASRRQGRGARVHGAAALRRGARRPGLPALPALPAAPAGRRPARPDARRRGEAAEARRPT
ncbi:hypothetical protein JL722_10999 [Aureococcus anophagefferens]|nr:hypothetical protein JL722_10999 [Aureococcus anophagefferens]